jgi:hypothetical protein
MAPPANPDRLRDPDPVIEAFKVDVDRTLLRESLKKTPQERLEGLQKLYDFSKELHRAGERLRER